VTVTVEYSIELPYAQLRSGGPPRPLIEVTLVREDVEFDVLCIVDSGADFPLLHTDFARILGFPLDAASLQPIHGIGGSGRGWFFETEMVVAGCRLRTQICFTDSWTPVYGLLGTAGFFDSFRVGFDHPRRRLLLEPLPSARQ
jgi:hypothetical protein